MTLIRSLSYLRLALVPLALLELLLDWESGDGAVFELRLPAG